jgi:3-hydroxyacyl-CoA dehydrogenase
MNYKIKKVAVLGSGVMGSRIACHFANIGVQVLLLDIAPNTLNDLEVSKNLTLESKLVKNRIVNDALASAVKSNPSPLYLSSFVSNITTGNFTDDLSKINEVDWIIEVVVENLKIKQQLFESVEKHRKPGTLISSNTSGIPIHLMCEGRSEDFVAHFCGTHFFNPPRYLKLLEIIPTPKTKPEVTDFLLNYGSLYLGKTTVLCKDTPAFIANRIGVYAIMEILHVVKKLGLSVEEVDKLTGSVIGHPKSATFRTGDVVGLDTLIKVANNLTNDAKNDEAIHLFELPDFLKKIDENKWYGDKSGQGFYKKMKNENGETEILSLDLETLTYKTQKKVKFATLEQTKPIESLVARLPILYNGKDVAGQFYQTTFNGLFNYVSHRIPEIANELYKIDIAVCAGFGWDMGPFEMWDAIGIQNSINIMETNGVKPATWVYEMLNDGFKTFYKIENGSKKYYDITLKKYQNIPGTEKKITLDLIRTKKVWGNSGTSLIDLGDGIVNLEFHTKMNTMGGEVIQGILKSIEIAEKDFRGLVIANEGVNFSAGANLAMLLMFAIDQEWEEIDLMVRSFQKATTRARFSSIPVVTAPHGLTLGGGCELNLHADAIQAAPETYIGMVEVGVGLIPGGGGTKEMTLRASDAFEEGDVELNTIKNTYMNIAMAKVANSAHEAKAMHIFRKSDGISMNQSMQIADAKKRVIELAEAGYTQPKMRNDIKVQGKSALSMFLIGAHSMYKGSYISEHDKKISEKLAWIMCGGDLSAPQKVSEQYLLDLEREAFLSLCGEKKTLERIQHTLKTGKPLRN